MAGEERPIAWARIVSCNAPVGIAAMLYGYDFELPLRDALNDPGLDPTRRALAALAIGTRLDDGHLAALELAGAAEQLAVDRKAGLSDEAGQGAARIRTILGAECDNYQRALWYAVSRQAPEAAAGHLRWLTRLMRGRTAMFRVIRESCASMPLLPGVVVDGNTAQLGPG